MGLWRFDLSCKPETTDAVAQQALHSLHDFGLTHIKHVRFSQLYLIDLLQDNHIESQSASRIARELLCDPVTQDCQVTGKGQTFGVPSGVSAVEVYFRPGVMDNVGNSTKLALADMGIRARDVRTARRYELSPPPSEKDLSVICRLLGNPSIEEVVVGTKPLAPAPLPPEYEFRLRTVPVSSLGTKELETLSRQGHLFLSVAEMQQIQAHYRSLGREPTDLELETIAQTWSEHCVHKTLKSAFVYRGAPFPGHKGSAEFTFEYGNLLKDTIARATSELSAERRGPECLSVFKDNAGIIAFDEEFGLAFKVETHNHPSAIEPYGGAATGVGGVIRDVLGCGLGAKPLANTDVFCVAPPDWPVDVVPEGVIHPRSVLKGVVAGVRDYGNRMGIPTVNGAVSFDPRYLGNPLVYCGCLGLIPRDRINKQVSAGDLIVLIGGRTGRDGIHGATFSSAELEHGHQDEFGHAVQIGNAIEEKKVCDVILQARDYQQGSQRVCLYSAITDCGAGGLSSAIGEMAAEHGAIVHLDRVPLKYSGLRYDEIWISEAQERMVLAVPPENIDVLNTLCAGEDVEASVLGEFTDTGRLDIRFHYHVVGTVDLHFLHEGIPQRVLAAEWRPKPLRAVASRTRRIVDTLKARLSEPNVASKHWITRQYDHEVQGRSVVKPLSGKLNGPSDAAVLRPRLDSYRGVAIGCGLAPQLSDVDPYLMAVASIDEAIRNVVCVGGDPKQTAILDNFCWPKADDPRHLGALVRACQACYDMAKLLGTPFISGKDSLNNEFSLRPDDAARLSELLAKRIDIDTESLKSNRLAIPYTLLISAISIVEDVRRCVTSAARPDAQTTYIHLLSTATSEWESISLAALPALHEFVADEITSGRALAVHDVSDGGVMVAISEMVMANDLACRVILPALGGTDPFTPWPSAYLVQTLKETSPTLGYGLAARCVAVIPPTSADAMLSLTDSKDGAVIDQVLLADLRRAWQQPLDW